MAASQRRSFPGRFTTKGVFRPTFRVPPYYKPPPGLIPPSVPSSPSGLAVVPSSGQVVLGWVEGYSNRRLTDYVVEYSIYGSGTWTTFTHAASTATTITITGLTNGTDYQFRVSAVSIYGTGSPCAAVAATVDTSIGYWGVFGANPGISPDSVRFTGGTISIVGSYVYHAFTSSGTLGWIGGVAVTGLEVQVCGGGGSGGSSDAVTKTEICGGGGAGGWQTFTGQTVSGSKTITVGGSGSPSTFQGLTSAEGGKTGGGTIGGYAGVSGQFGSGAGHSGQTATPNSGGSTTGSGYRGGNAACYASGSFVAAGAGASHAGQGTDAVVTSSSANIPMAATAGVTRWLGIETGYGGGTGSLSLANMSNSTRSNPAYGSGGCGGNGYYGDGHTGRPGVSGIIIVRYLAV